MPLDTVSNIENWFHKAHGDHPHKKLTVQTGVHFEEVSEMLEALTTNDKTAEVLMRTAELALKDLATFLKQNSQTVVLHAKEPTLLLDSLCDQIVTAVGVGVDCNFMVSKALTEVSRSNYSKFVGGFPLFDENGKIKKGPDYTPPNLVGYVK